MESNVNVRVRGAGSQHCRSLIHLAGFVICGNFVSRLAGVNVAAPDVARNTQCSCDRITVVAGYTVSGISLI